MNAFGFFSSYNLFDFGSFNLQFLNFELPNFIDGVKSIIKEEKCKINKDVILALFLN